MATQHHQSRELSTYLIPQHLFCNLFQSQQTLEVVRRFDHPSEQKKKTGVETELRAGKQPRQTGKPEMAITRIWPSSPHSVPLETQQSKQCTQHVVHRKAKLQHPHSPQEM
jgi:hypothetical protein